MRFPPSPTITPSDATIKISTTSLEQIGETIVSNKLPRKKNQSSTITVTEMKTERGSCLFAMLECVVYTSYCLFPLLFFAGGPFLVLVGALGATRQPVLQSGQLPLAWEKYLDDEPSSVMEVQGKVTMSREGVDESTGMTTVSIQYVVATEKDDEDVLLLYQITKTYNVLTAGRNHPAPLVGTNVRLLVLQGYPKSAKMAADIWEAEEVALRDLEDDPYVKYYRLGCVLSGVFWIWFTCFLFPIMPVAIDAIFWDDMYDQKGFALYLAVWLLLLLLHVIVYVLFWVIFPIVVRVWELEQGTLVGSLSDNPGLKRWTEAAIP
jgi:hypothetical protein